eukprot:7333143-Heterocapsa_arctica.AAC.1
MFISEIRLKGPLQESRNQKGTLQELKRHRSTVRKGTVWGGGDHNNYNEPWLDKSSKPYSGAPRDRTLGNHGDQQTIDEHGQIALRWGHFITTNSADYWLGELTIAK